MNLTAIEHTHVHGSPERRFDLTFDDEFTVATYLGAPDTDEFIAVDSTQIPSTAPGDLEDRCRDIVMATALIFDLDLDW